MELKKEILKNYDLVNLDLGAKKGKFYRTIFPELPIEIRTCLQNALKHKSVEFVFEKKIEIKEKLEVDETSGIEIKIHEDYTNSQNNLIDIKLKNNNLLEIYLEFLENIIENIKSTSNKTAVVNLILKKINIWIRFFKKKKFEGLSEEEIRGLIGELLFIKKFSLNENFKDNILRWKGCENGLHDFDFKEKKAEIKTFAQSGIIRISLIDQLDIQKNKNIYLICFGLSKKDGQFSLNDLINEIQKKLDDDLSFIFKDKLKSYGYFEIHKNDYNEKYRNFDEHFYKITSEFPKILSKDTQSGITNISYGLDTNLLSSFDIGKNKIKEVFTDEKN
mgnify:CR=1 FL=1